MLFSVVTNDKNSREKRLKRNDCRSPMPKTYAYLYLYSCPGVLTIFEMGCIADRENGAVLHFAVFHDSA